MKINFLPRLLYADNTTLNAGSAGDVIGSDDISSVKYQRIKLIHGADGTNDGDVSSANPLPVRGITVIVTSTITMSVAGAYATGDYIGTSTSPQSFANAVRVSGGTGLIKSIRISDKNTTAAVAMELWLLSATFTAPTDNAAWAISDAEAFTVLGVIPIMTSNWYASSNNKVYFDGNISIVIKPAATSLFYALVARGTTPSWTSGDLEIGLGILQD